MKDSVQVPKQQTSFRIEDLPTEERGRLVGAFVWLIEEDKKQNPALYQRKTN